MNPDTTRRRILIMLVLMLVVALTGCGDATEEAAAPEFSMTNAIGGTVKLSDYSGDPVLLFFHMADG